MAGGGRESHPEGWEGLGGPPGGLGGWGGMGAVGRPSWRDGKGQEVVSKGREESGVSSSVLRGSQEALPEEREVLGGVGMPSWMAVRG